MKFVIEQYKSFIDKLIADKKDLNEKILQLGDQLKVSSNAQA